MLLIIENKDDPAGQLAEETNGPADYAYIPLIQAPLETSIQQERLKNCVDQMCFERRENQPAESIPNAANMQGRLSLFLKAVSRIGEPPQYLTETAENACEISPQKKLSGKLYTRG